MHDIRKIREDRDQFARQMARRFAAVDLDEILSLDEAQRKATADLQALQTQRNLLSKSAASPLKEENRDKIPAIKQEIRAKEQLARQYKEQLHKILFILPNQADDDVPDGEDEAANIEIRKFGAPPDFSFLPKHHYEIGENLGLLDFSVAAKLAGARFAVLRGAFARLERALASFMLDIHTSRFGYQEILPPFLVRTEVMQGTGQLPKFAEDLFVTSDERWLIPTAEAPLTNMVREEICDNLPLRFTAWTPCFRREAGAAGRDTRGLLRMHQFSKVELVSITSAQESETELERMTKCAETVLRELGLAYRVVLLSAGDMGFSASKTYDIEVWMAGAGCYREISSCSNCRDFQARRMQSRYRLAAKKTDFVHTLNGSGVAIGRCLAALVENYQCEDGSIRLPKALVPYMGMEYIKP